MAQQSLLRGTNRLYLVLVSLLAVTQAQLNFEMPQQQHLSTEYQNFVRGEGSSKLAYTDRVKPITHQLHFDFFESVLNAAAPDWNYDNQGRDWNMSNCANINQTAMSPINITTVDNPGQSYRDWSESQFSFLPNYGSTVITNETKLLNYTHTFFLKPNDDEFSNGVYASEPLVTTSRVVHQVRWRADYVKFHYPAEHAYKGYPADLEMQVYHSDLDTAASTCKSGQAVVSVFFNMSCPEQPEDQCDEPGEFFNFIDWAEESGNPKSMDLSQVLPSNAALLTDISGYAGSFSVPPCDKDLCWYIHEKHYQLTGEQYQYFQVDGVSSNARAMNLSPIKKYAKILRNEGLFAN